MPSHVAKKRKLSLSHEGNSIEDDEADILTGSTSRSKSETSVDEGKNVALSRKTIQSKAPMNRDQTVGQRSRTDRSTAELASASGLYKSGLFKLQIDELLSELRPNHAKQVSRVENTLHTLRYTIETIPSRSPKSILEAEEELRKISALAVPFPEPRPTKDAKYTLEYSSPSNINVVGSLALKTSSRTANHTTIDLAVTLPRVLFQEKDHLNFRYFHKRAYYLACIAAGLKENKELAAGIKIMYSYQDDNTLRPVLLIEPAADANTDFSRSKCRIRVILAIDHDIFPVSKTLPGKNNVRHSDLIDPSSEPSSVSEPTPVYNASLRSEATVAAYHSFLLSSASKCGAFRDACILGRTWLYQRGFGTSFTAGGFGHFEWAALMASLLEGGGANGKPLLSTSYSSYQLFKATIQFLAGKDLYKPFLMYAKDVVIPASNSPVFFDGKRGLNILYKMAQWSYGSLRHEAATTLSMLNDAGRDHFDRVFIVRIDEPLLRYDRLLSIRLPFSSGCSLRLRKAYDSLHTTVTKALGNRAKLVGLTVPEILPWPLKKSLPVQLKENITVTVGLSLEPDETGRIVDHGPSAEDKEAAALFRQFWGEKAELRRFKDGSILESLVWSDHPTDPPILRQITIYILQRHFKIPADDINFVGDDFDARLCKGTQTLSQATDSFQSLIDEFQTLEKNIQDLGDLPLTLRQLSSASPSLRYASLEAPADKNGSASALPADITLQFEASARWPDDLTAIQMTKMAFLIKIGDVLQESGAVLMTRVGIENEGSRILNNGFLDISRNNGTTFRLRIHHDREQTLLERQLKDKSMGVRAKEETAFALATYNREFVQAPRHTQSIRALCTRFPLLSPTIRLMKQWCHSHFFSPHLSEELIELLTVRVFVHPYPWGPPSSVMSGFLRALHFLSRWDWQREPLVIDFSHELTPQDIDVVNTRFDAWRKVDPSMNTVSMFVASNHDLSGTTWTQFNKPPKVVASRLSSLAKAAIKMVKEKGVHLSANDLFRSPLSDYDFLIFLDGKALGVGQKKEQRVFKNLRQDTGDRQVTAQEVVQYFVNDLHLLYGQDILFSYGGESAPVIAGLWKPQALQTRPLGLKLTYSTAPTSSNKEKRDADEVSINKPAILNEIASLAGGLVKHIQVNR